MNDTPRFFSAEHKVAILREHLVEGRAVSDQCEKHRPPPDGVLPMAETIFVVFLRGAEADLLTAWMRYEEILPGLGERFEVEVRAALFRTDELPESAPIYAGEIPAIVGAKV
jgi:hypothetical protein